VHPSYRYRRVGFGCVIESDIVNGMGRREKRCEWATSELMVAYHDTEWGVPVFDDRLLFEFLILEGAQAGLSWETVLRKRDEYRKVFRNFEIPKVAKMSGRDVERLLGNPGIIRNRAKVESSIGNAKVALELQEEFGSLAEYLWSFVDGSPVQNGWKTMEQIPAQTEMSVAMSKALKFRGMKFVGPTICYAFMQAAGLVNDHLEVCPRWRILQ